MLGKQESAKGDNRKKKKTCTYEYNIAQAGASMSQDQGVNAPRRMPGALTRHRGMVSMEPEEVGGAGLMWCVALVMFPARPRAGSQAKPGYFGPGWAGPVVLAQCWLMAQLGKVRSRSQWLKPWHLSCDHVDGRVAFSYPDNHC